MITVTILQYGSGRYSRSTTISYCGHNCNKLVPLIYRFCVPSWTSCMKFSDTISLLLSMIHSSRKSTVYQMSKVLEYSISTLRRSRKETQINAFDEIFLRSFLFLIISLEDNAVQSTHIDEHINDISGPVVLLRGILAKFSNYI